MSTIKTLVEDARQRMHASVETVRRELAAMRTGRASLAMLDGIKVDYYGTLTPLNQLGNLATPDPTLITIQPWEPSLLAPIEKALRASDLDLNPQNDGKIIRIPVPPLRERREDIAALAEHFWREATARIVSRATLASTDSPGLAASATVARPASVGRPRYDW